MGTQKQSHFLRLRSPALRLTLAVLLPLMGCLISSDFARAQTPNLLGEWQWHSVGITGRLKITQELSDGRFSGEYIVDYQSKIEGRLQGDQIEFVRSFTWTDGTQKEQRYKVTLVGSGNNLRMVNGSWIGFDTHTDNGGGDFSAEKIQPTPAPQPIPKPQPLPTPQPTPNALADVESIGPCKSLELSYSPNPALLGISPWVPGTKVTPPTKVKQRDVEVSPTLTFSPEGCTKPGEMPRFYASDEQRREKTFDLDSQTGFFTTFNAGVFEIGVRVGALSNSTKILVDYHPCTELSLSGDVSPIKPGDSTSVLVD